MKHIAMRAAWIALIWSVAGCGGGAEPPSLDPTRTPTAGSARGALLVAHVAASAWMSDAELLYIENDAHLSDRGRAPAWGFLFYSKTARGWRNVAVQGRDVVYEGGLEYPFTAPEIVGEWIDSDQALAIAEKAGGAAFRTSASADLAHAILSRGVFNDPDGAPTWTLIYRSHARGELAIIVDATSGRVLGQVEG